MISSLVHYSPDVATRQRIAVGSLAIVFLWFAAMNLTGTATPIVARWLTGHTSLSGRSLNSESVAIALGAAQALGALLLLAGRTRKAGATILLLISLGALSLLFTNPVWDDSLGGFPAIGSGQSILKYATIAGLCLYVLQQHRAAHSFMLGGLLLVLVWIGGMKFTGPEAAGIAPLLSTSPVFNWWLVPYFSDQGASNVIGVLELVTVILLTGAWWNKGLFRLGLLACAATFVVTLSFLASFDPAWTSAGFPYLGSGGQFLLKDLLLLAGTILLLPEKA
ncbi:DUF417 family protein [Gimibacter soli]|uniref:DUF417 family protein n=1 Tax=Gimibacter soli TaxID=3024400 RepID=A0AAF0BKC4_9PROT|nr:DUF417 family protein [Gimibacter soli]WCL52802.1 DUF417 family protein [Gimibacter soli]